MASNAVKLANLSSGDTFTVNNSTSRVGIVSTVPSTTLDVDGTITATTFVVDGFTVSGVSTFQNDVKISDNRKVILGDDSDLQISHIAGNSFIQDKGSGVLLITTDGPGIQFMNDAQTEFIAKFQKDGAVELYHDSSKKLETSTDGISVTGGVSASSISVTGNVSVGGTLTYEDVANVDSIGIVTARSGLIVTAGVSTVSGGLNTEDILAEEVKVTVGKLSDNTNINVEDGMVHLFTTTETTTSTPNIRYNGSTALNARMSMGQSIVVTLITTAAAAAYSANITIDGGAVTENWIGGSAPSSGGSSGVDIHTFTIIKTGDATFTVIGNQSKTS